MLLPTKTMMMMERITQGWIKVNYGSFIGFVPPNIIRMKQTGDVACKG
jgi:hypothetical protein